jgi:hypothetical protein
MGLGQAAFLKSIKAHMQAGSYRNLDSALRRPFTQAETA